MTVGKTEWGTSLARRRKDWKKTKPRPTNKEDDDDVRSNDDGVDDNNNRQGVIIDRGQ